MNSRIVIKDNTLINSSYSLSLTETRLILFCISQAQKNNKKINFLEYVEVDSLGYSEFFKLNSNAISRDLKIACNSLIKRYFSYSYYNEKGKLVLKQSNWVQSTDYIESEGRVKLLFTKEIIPFISELEKNFTSYYFNDISEMTSTYAVRLYEIIIAWRSVGKTPIFKLNDFREKLGVQEHEYTRMTNFKSRVLDVAVKQINELSNIKIELDQHKNGRNISGFSFKINDKTKNTGCIKQNKTLTDSQRIFFAKKLSEMPEMSKYSQGTESYSEFAERISNMLNNPKELKVLMPLLEKLNFKAKSNNN